MPWYVALYELLLHVSLCSLLLSALAWCAVCILRQPARRIGVIQWAMIGLMALPAIALVPGYPRVAVLPAWEVEPDGTEVKAFPAKPETGSPLEKLHSAKPSALPGGRTANHADVPPIHVQTPPAINSPQMVAAEATPLRSDDAPPHATRVSSPTTKRSPDQFHATNASPPAERLADYRLWVVAIYLGGVAAMLGWSLLGVWSMRRLVASSQVADEHLRNVLRDLAGPASDRVRLLVSSRAAQPCAFGWWRPTIVLPQSLIESGDHKQRRFALAHEWSHVSRGDVGVWLLAGLARILHFHQPLVWLLRSQLRLSQDYLADAAASGAGTPEDYAEFLTGVTQKMKRQNLAPGLGIAGRRSELHRRVVMLVEEHPPLERATPKRWRVLLLLSGLLAVATVASLRAEPSRAKSSQLPVQQSSVSEPLSYVEINGIRYQESIDPKTGKILRTAVGPRAANSEVPLELRPERIQENMRRYSAADLAVHLDSEIRRLETRLKALLDFQSLGVIEPDGQLKQKIKETQKQLEQRRAEVRKSAIQSAAASEAGIAWTPQQLQALLGQRVQVYRETLERLREAPEDQEKARTLSREILRLEGRLRDLAKDAEPTAVAESGAESAAQVSSPDVAVDMLLEKDPVIAKLSEQLRGYLNYLERVKAVPADSPQIAEYINILQREILRLEETKNERVAELRPQVLKRLQRQSSQAQDPSKQLVTDVPFSGRIRPGDILNLGLAVYPTHYDPRKTVEPDGNLPISAAYGSKSRIHVAGMTLIEAGKHIEHELREFEKNPKVLLTYVGHDNGVVTAEHWADSKPPSAVLSTEPVKLAPLDTIEIWLGSDSWGAYLIEPDGQVLLSRERVAIAGNTEQQAAEVVRAHLAKHRAHLHKYSSGRKALPSAHIKKRGRAVFGPGKEPGPDYRIRTGDHLLLNQGNPFDGSPYKVNQEGDIEKFIGYRQVKGERIPAEHRIKVHVQGLTLTEAQQAVVEASRDTNLSVTIGDWHEEADPKLIDQLEHAADPAVQKLERELDELKAMIRALKR